MAAPRWRCRPHPTRTLPYSYTFLADVEGVSGQHIANRASLVAHPASLYIAVSRPPMFVNTRPARPSASSPSIFRAICRGRPGDGLARSRGVGLRAPDRWSQALGAPRDPRWRVDGATAPATAPLRFRCARAAATSCARPRAMRAGRPTRTEVRFYAFGPGARRGRARATSISRRSVRRGSPAKRRAS